MKAGTTCLGLLLAITLVLGACGGDDGVPPGSGGSDDGVVGPPPTKEAVIAVLRDLLGALEANDYDRAITHFVAFPGRTEEAMKTSATGFIDKREISKAGIDILAERGEFGPLADVLPGGGAGSPGRREWRWTGATASSAAMPSSRWSRRAGPFSSSASTTSAS